MKVSNRADRYESKSSTKNSRGHGDGVESYPVGTNSFEVVRTFPEEIGFGHSRIVKLFSGMYLCITNHRYLKDFTFKIDENLPDLGFGFCLSGQMIVNQDCLKHEFFIGENQSAFYYFPDNKGSCKVNADKSVLTIHILMESDFFTSLMEEEQHYKSESIRRLVENKHGDAFRHANMITPSMKLIMEQIMNCPDHGLTRRFFFEAKAMELVFHKLKQLESLEIQPGKISERKVSNAEKIYQAGKTLTKNLQTPPGLMDLSRSVGLSRTQLLKDFPKIFGTSPYGYLRNIRLETARMALHNNRMNITQVAHLVGYSSSSHFTKAFKQYFGMTPSRHMKEMSP